MEPLTQTIVSGLISGGLISVVAGFVLHSRSQRIEAEIKNQFQKQYDLFQSQRKWKEKSFEELLGPVYMQLDRTKRAFDRWKEKNLYLELNVIHKGNKTIRDLLLNKGHLIPTELTDHAGLLIDHYDGWLQRFDEVRVKKEAGEDVPFVFTYDFPGESAKAFRDAFHTRRTELYR